MKQRNEEAARQLADIAHRATSALSELVTRGKLDSIQVMHVRGIIEQATFVAGLFEASSKR